MSGNQELCTSTLKVLLCNFYLLNHSNGKWGQVKSIIERVHLRLESVELSEAPHPGNRVGEHKMNSFADICSSSLTSYAYSVQTKR